MITVVELKPCIRHMQVVLWPTIFDFQTHTQLQFHNVDTQFSAFVQRRCNPTPFNEKSKVHLSTWLECGGLESKCEKHSPSTLCLEISWCIDTKFSALLYIGVHGHLVAPAPALISHLCLPNALTAKLSFTAEDLIQVCQANVTAFGSHGKLKKVEHQHEHSLPNTSGCKMYILIPKRRSTLSDECFTVIDQWSLSVV